MNIELKKFKYLKRASEETICYEADLYVDGVCRAFCSNSGCGGCDMIHFKDHEWRKKLERSVESMPEEPCGFDPGQTYRRHLDDITQGMACELAERKSRDREVWFRAVGKDYPEHAWDCISVTKGWTKAQLLAHVRGKYPGARIKNDEDVGAHIVTIPDVEEVAHKEVA